MTSVKRGGGTGRGSYGQGLSSAGGGAGEPGPAPRPADPLGEHFGFPDASDGPGPARAYRVTTEREALGHQTILDLLARIVAVEELDPRMSLYYQDALVAFGSTSPHFLTACQGQTGAGTHYLNGYLNAVAAGRIRLGS